MNLSFFLEMVWKSAFIAGVALLLAALLKPRSAADRASVLQVGLLLLILLPLVSLFLPAWQVEVAAAEAPQPLVGTLLQLQQAAPAIVGAAPSGMPTSDASLASGAWDDPTMIVAMLYFGGLLMAAARLIGGLVTLGRWTAQSEPISCPHWIRALDRVAQASGSPPVSLRVSVDAPAPLSWGWLRPVILVDADAYRRGEHAEAILAHELAHIVRRDWPALMLSRIATTLFWFNPLVWLLGKAFIRHAEEAADCHALAQVEATHYAQALLGCASHAAHRGVPANSIASSDLGKRVHAILDGSSRSIPSGSRLCAATILGCLAVAGPVSAMKLIPAAAAKMQVSLAPPAPEALQAPAPAKSTITPAPVGATSYERIAVAERPPAPPPAPAPALLVEPKSASKAITRAGKAVPAAPVAEAAAPAAAPRAPPAAGIEAAAPTPPAPTNRIITVRVEAPGRLAMVEPHEFSGRELRLFRSLRTARQLDPNNKAQLEDIKAQLKNNKAQLENIKAQLIERRLAIEVQREQL